MLDADGLTSDQVQAFLALHRSGTFTGAAVTLQLSQPAVSRRVAMLERAVGGALFERVPSGVALTEAGVAFLPHAEAIVVAQRDAVAAVADVTDGRAGTVTLAIVATLASRDLGRELRAFRAARPGVDLRLRTAISADVSDLVRRGVATLGVRYGSDPTLDTTVLREEEWVTVCAHDHPLAGGRASAADLVGERWLGFPPRADDARDDTVGALEALLARTGLGDAEVIPIDSLTAQVRLAEAGFGLALLPRTAVDGELRHGALATVELPAPAPTIPVVLVTRPNAFVGAAGRALVARLGRVGDGAGTPVT